MTTRFPFSAFPSGWFRVGYSGELPPGKVKPLHYLGQDLVLFRTANENLSPYTKLIQQKIGSRLMAGNMFLQVAKTPIWDLAWLFVLGLSNL